MNNPLTMPKELIPNNNGIKKLQFKHTVKMSVLENTIRTQMIEYIRLIIDAHPDKSVMILDGELLLYCCNVCEISFNNNSIVGDKEQFVIDIYKEIFGSLFNTTHEICIKQLISFLHSSGLIRTDSSKVISYLKRLLKKIRNL